MSPILQQALEGSETPTKPKAAVTDRLSSISGHFLHLQSTTTMALAELCGLDTQFRFNLRKNVLPMEADIAQFTGNLFDNCQLAIPPYANVS